MFTLSCKSATETVFPAAYELFDFLAAYDCNNIGVTCSVVIEVETYYIDDSR